MANHTKSEIRSIFNDEMIHEFETIFSVNLVKVIPLDSDTNQPSCKCGFQCKKNCCSRGHFGYMTWHYQSSNPAGTGFNKLLQYIHDLMDIASAQ